MSVGHPYAQSFGGGTLFLGEPALSPSRLTIAVQTDAGQTTLTVGGEIDIVSAPTLERELRRAEGAVGGRIVLDLAALEFIDSTGIHLLVDAQRRTDANGQQLVLTRVPPNAHRLFRLTGLDARLAIA